MKVQDKLQHSTLGEEIAYQGVLRKYETLRNLLAVSFTYLGVHAFAPQEIDSETRKIFFSLSGISVLGFMITCIQYWKYQTKHEREVVKEK